MSSTKLSLRMVREKLSRSIERQRPHGEIIQSPFPVRPGESSDFSLHSGTKVTNQSGKSIIGIDAIIGTMQT